MANTIRSDYAHAQADLSLCWAHMSEGTFSHVAAKFVLILIFPVTSLCYILSVSTVLSFCSFNFHNVTIFSVFHFLNLAPRLQNFFHAQLS